MKRYLPLLGVFILFLLVVSGFAHGKTLNGSPVHTEQATTLGLAMHMAPEIR